MLLAAVWLFSAATAVRADPLLIHHPSISQETLNSGALVRIYAMQKRAWSNGSRVSVFIMPKDITLHRQFVQRYLHMQPYQLDRFWHRLVFSGTGTIPQVVASVEEMIEKVAATPGAIGYIDSAEVDRIDDAMLTVKAHET
ncbi:hypothetical protein NBRC116495_08850 [Aurantivibrio plasticivorans]